MTIRAATRLGTLGALIAVASLLAGGGRGLAQGATPAAGNDAIPAHPVHIHEGSCASLDPSPRFPLTDVPGEPAQDGGAGAEAAIPGAMSVTTLDVPLADLLAGGNAINVHASTDNIESYIACGDVGGAVGDGNLVIGLREQNGSGYAGVAHLHGAGEETHVTVFLVRGLAGATGGGEGAEAQAAEAQVAFRVPTITCPACPARVEASLEKAPGILGVVIAGQDVTVSYDPSQVSPEEIAAAIEAGGDTVEPRGA